MRLFSWNINGIRAVIAKGEFENFITTYQPDVICLQETKAHREQIDFDFGSYTEHFYSATKKGYSGTAILSRTPALQYRNGIPDDIAEKFQLTGDAYGNPNDEGRIIAAEFDGFWLVTCYTPNSKGDLSRLQLRHTQWDPACLAYLKALESGRYGAAKPVMYCGDMNVAHTEIDLARPKENIGKHGFTDQERAGFQAYLDAGFVDAFRTQHPDREHAYTWWTHWGNARARNIGWRIDYWLASASIAHNITTTNIHPEQMGSDHCPVSIEITELTQCD